MKYVSVLILAMCVQIGLAQSSNNLKGPAAKNYKAWKDKDLKGTSVNLASTSDKYEEGANAKNAHVISENVEVTVTPQTNLKRGKGANAKNRKYFTKKSTVAPTKQKAVQKKNEQSIDRIIQKR